jgi:hypothetical protein
MMLVAPQHGGHCNRALTPEGRRRDNWCNEESLMTPSARDHLDRSLVLLSATLSVRWRASAQLLHSQFISLSWFRLAPTWRLLQKQYSLSFWNLFLDSLNFIFFFCWISWCYSLNSHVSMLILGSSTMPMTCLIEFGGDCKYHWFSWRCTSQWILK